MQEINGWQEDDFAKLKDFAKRTGLSNYVYGDSDTEYKLATFSKLPILSHQIHTKGFWHCAIETRLAMQGVELTVFNLHLNPQRETPRKAEIAQLLTMIDTAENVVLTGDFNSLSKRDNYPDSLLADLQAHGITKFGRHQLEFAVTDQLEAAGLIDVAAKLDKMSTTVPSKFNTDKNHELPLRLDYVFVTKSLIDRVEDIAVVKTEVTEAISDHYGVRVVISS